MSYVTREGLITREGGRGDKIWDGIDLMDTFSFLPETNWHLQYTSVV